MRIKKIRNQLRRIRLYTLAANITVAVSVLVLINLLAWIVSSVLDIGFGLTGMVLKPISIGFFIISLAAFAYLFVRLLLMSHSLRAYAQRIAAEFKEMGFDLLTALDLENIDAMRFGYSQTLIGNALTQIEQRVEQMGIDLVRERRRVISILIGIGAACLFLSIWGLFDLSRITYSLKRHLYFLGFRDSPGFEVIVEPGNADVLVGQDMEVKVEIQGFSPARPRIHIMTERGEIALAMTPLIKLGGMRSFVAHLGKVEMDLDYLVKVLEVTSPLYHIRVYDNPKIVGGSITLVYPTYTKRGEQVLPLGIWDIMAPYGTIARFSLKANCIPDSAFVEFIDGQDRSELIEIPGAGDSLVFERRLLRDRSYTVEIVANGKHRFKHGPYSIKIIEDTPPFVRIESPEQEMMLEADMVVPLSILAIDDYGISSMRLNYSATSETSSFSLDYTGLTQARSTMDWNVGVFDLFPGETITYQVVVADNDALTGPKTARSPVYVLRVPSVHELFNIIEEKQETDLEAIEEIAEQATELKKEVDKLIENMKSKPEIDWEREEQIRQGITRQEEIRQQIEKISSSLDETLQQMGEASLISFEVIDKMEQIRQLLSEVATDELLQAIQRMQEALERLSPEEIRKAMENLSLSQEELLRRLDRTIEMLKRLKVEQKINAAVNLANQIIEKQDRVNKQVEEGDLSEASSREKQVIGETEALERMLSELADLLHRDNNPAAGKVDEAQEVMKSEQIMGNMELALKAMQAGNRSSAGKHGGEAKADMETVASMLGSALETFMGEDKKQIVEAIKNALQKIRVLSQRHEDVLRSIERADTEDLVDLARKEAVYKDALDALAKQIFEETRKNLFLSSSLVGAVLKISNEVRGVANSLSQNQSGAALRQGRNALGMMNTVMISLMDALDQASSCSSPGGLSDSFERLESLCGMQMGINQATQQLQGMDELGLSMEVRAQMARLAAEQEAVRQGIQELTQSVEAGSEILGRLDDLIEEARRVIEDLKASRVDKETIERQEKILTRLLNAQRSMRRRDYSRVRKSRPGEEYKVVPPQGISLDEHQAAMKDLLYRRRGTWPPEYEDLIRAYMEAISSRRER
ncbi:MAG: hypothetical protein ACUVQ7_01210 [bacterium]